MNVLERLRARTERAREGGDRGESLVEMVVAAMLMLTVVVAVLGAFGTAGLGSSLMRSMATTDSALMSWRETMIGARAYTPCASSSAYTSSSLGWSAASGLTEPTVKVEYWDGASSPAGFTPACPSGGDRGAQRITLTTTPVNAAGAETKPRSLTFVIKRTS